MKLLIRIIFILFIFWAGILSANFLKPLYSNIKPQTLKKIQITEKPLEKYTIENLQKSDIKKGKLEILRTIKEEEEYTSYLFNFTFNPDLNSEKTKITTGQINIPKKGIQSSEKYFPVIVMFRGYVDQITYKTGDGTRNAAKFFANNGFITIAPDFLGYGESDKEADNIFESRFQTYVTAISLLKTIKEFNENPNLFTNSSVSIWAHSNGGQIALTALEVTGETYPTILWAPVSKPFPYSILYYTDESDDRGKLIRSELSKFEKDYNVEKYSLTNYLDKIKAPIQIEQGISDEEVPVSWTNLLVNSLKDLNIDVTYNTYKNTDHNMQPSWDIAIQKDLEFIKKYF